MINSVEQCLFEKDFQVLLHRLQDWGNRRKGSHSSVSKRWSSLGEKLCWNCCLALEAVSQEAVKHRDAKRGIRGAHIQSSCVQVEGTTHTLGPELLRVKGSVRKCYPVPPICLEERLYWVPDTCGVDPCVWSGQPRLSPQSWREAGTLRA